MLTSRDAQIILLKRHRAQVDLLQADPGAHDGPGDFPGPVHSLCDPQAPVRLVNRAADVHRVQHAQRLGDVVRPDDEALPATLMQLLRAEFVQQRALVDDAVGIGDLAQLIQNVAGDHDGDAPLVAQPGQHFPHLHDALGVQTVDGLVQYDQLGVAHQRQRDAQALPHAQGIGAGALFRVRVLKADGLEQSLHIALPHWVFMYI